MKEEIGKLSEIINDVLDDEYIEVERKIRIREKIIEEYFREF